MLQSRGYRVEHATRERYFVRATAINGNSIGYAFAAYIYARGRALPSKYIECRNIRKLKRRWRVE